MTKKRALILTDRPLHNGPRILREIEALSPFCEIVAVGKTQPTRSDVKFVQSKGLRRAGFRGRVYKKVYRLFSGGAKYPGALPCVKEKVKKVLQDFRPDIVIAHDPEWLPYLVELKNGFKLVYNAHEYHPLELDEDPDWMRTHGRSYYQVYKTCLPSVDVFVNVCESIAEKCRQEFNKESLVIPNASRYHPSLKANKVDPDRIKIIHHGGAMSERQIEIMIDAVKMLDRRFQLDLMLVPSQEDLPYFMQIKEAVDAVPNVRIIDPISYHDIIPFINQYDIGMYNLPPLSYNNKIALPNKVFEFIQARLCLVVSPSVEMARMVHKHQVGIVAKGFDAMAFYESMRQLDAESIETYKQNASKAAMEESAENYQAQFVRAVLA